MDVAMLASSYETLATHLTPKIIERLLEHVGEPSWKSIDSVFHIEIESYVRTGLTSHKTENESTTNCMKIDALKS